MIENASEQVLISRTPLSKKRYCGSTPWSPKRTMLNDDVREFWKRVPSFNIVLFGVQGVLAQYLFLEGAVGVDYKVSTTRMLIWHLSTTTQRHT